MTYLADFDVLGRPRVHMWLIHCMLQYSPKSHEIFSCVSLANKAFSSLLSINSVCYMTCNPFSSSSKAQNATVLHWQRRLPLFSFKDILLCIFRACTSLQFWHQSQSTGGFCQNSQNLYLKLCASRRQQTSSDFVFALFIAFEHSRCFSLDLWSCKLFYHSKDITFTLLDAST